MISVSPALIDTWETPVPPSPQGGENMKTFFKCFSLRAFDPSIIYQKCICGGERAEVALLGACRPVEAALHADCDSVGL